MEGSRFAEILQNHEGGVNHVLDKPTLQDLLPELRQMNAARAHDTFGKQLLRQLLHEVPTSRGSGEISDADLCIRWPSKKYEPIMLQYCSLLFELNREYDEAEVTQKIKAFLNTRGEVIKSDRPNPVSMRRAMVDAGVLKRDGLGTFYIRDNWWPEPNGPIYF
ncbi:hypothetical protein BJ742DRAFT_833881 [Cladochytrium replicatum]|nr:hypothetical protein BJ742DRAFT_833881 [Cladochytrium replicatum]